MARSKSTCKEVYEAARFFAANGVAITPELDHRCVRLFGRHTPDGDQIQMATMFE
jgi:hypothetical protein